MKIRTEDFILQTSKQGNFYIVDADGSNIMVPKAIGQKWDELDEVTIGERKFTKATDPESGELVDKDWSRKEIVGKKDVLASATKKARVFQAKTTLLNAATEYEAAKKKALQASELSAENKEELEKLLNF